MLCPEGLLYLATGSSAVGLEPAGLQGDGPQLTIAKLMPSVRPINSAQLRPLRAALLRWYDKNRRDLPWRRTNDPYSIWVSEIMLQQTRVSAVLEHYRQFVEQFPNMQALAKAKLPAVLAAWSGLGYYRRAKAMHEAARVIVREHDGRLPQSIEGLRRLPGIGRYTSAAVGSIAFGIPAAVVDGNVERVLARLGGKALVASEAWERAQLLLDARRPGDWNQAMMELGATVCVSVGPRCMQCPVRQWCAAPGADTSRSDARRLKKQYAVGLATKEDAVYLVQRARGESLMPGMWELPEATEGQGKQLARVKHSITVTDFDVSVVEFAGNVDGRGRWVKTANLLKLPLTGLTRKILRAAKLMPSGPNRKTVVN